MAFEKFANQNKRYDGRITITKSYNFGFPARFFSDNHLDTINYVVLFFDPETKEIGFQFTNDENERHKYKLFGQGKVEKGYGGSIIATSFFKSYNIDPLIQHGKYVPEKKQIEGVGELFVIRLTDKSAADNTGSETNSPPQ